jgi:Na+/H+-dicarboxylate symporter
MLQIIVFALLVGYAISRAGEPGRRIATLRTRELHLTVPTAFLSPGPAAVG